MSGNSHRSTKLRRMPDSPLPSSSQSNSEPTKRPSVFERLGNRPSQMKVPLNYERKESTDSRKVVSTKKPQPEPEENDLRFKMRKNKPSASPQPMRRVSSPPSPKTSPKGDQKRSSSKLYMISNNSGKDENKIKSLIGMVSVQSSKRTPSPNRHRLDISSHIKRARYEDCDDEEELEKKRQQLQRELELEIEREKKEKRELQKGGKNSYGSLTGTCSTSESRSLCSSAASSASGYYSTHASYSKSGSSCSHSSDEHKVKSRRRSHSPTPSGSSLRTSHRSPHVSRSSVHGRSRSPKSPPRSLSSSSQPRRPRLTPPHESMKPTDLKFDRHGNVRVSLREKERQRKLEREQALQRQRSPNRYERKDPIDDKRLSRHDAKKHESGLSRGRSIESSKQPIMPRLHSRSRSPRKSREASPERRRIDDRRKYDQHDIEKDRRYEKDDHRRDAGDPRGYRKSDRDLPSRPRTPPPLKGACRQDEEEARVKSKQSYDDHKYLEKDKKRSHSPSSYTRSPTYSNYRSYDGKIVKGRTDSEKDRLLWEMKKSPHSYSRDLSPAQSLISKRSRASSLGSDISRPSVSSRNHSKKNVKKEVSNKPDQQLSQSTSNKEVAAKINEPSKNKTTLHANEDMSPISNDSSFGDLDENETSLSEVKSEKRVETKEKKSKRKSEETVSEQDFSDFSDDVDFVLQSCNNEEMENDDAGRFSRSQEKESVKYADANRTSIAEGTTDSQEDFTKKVDDDALEAISDDELDAIIGEPDPLDVCSDSNSASGQKLLDALEIDWSSLVCQNSSQQPSLGSARKRFSPSNVLMTIGFSQHLAGADLTEKIINYCREEQGEHFRPFRHPVAALHCFINEQLDERNRIFGKATMNSTALNARKDLELRKFLSKSHFLIDEYHHLKEPSLVL